MNKGEPEITLAPLSLGVLCDDSTTKGSKERKERKRCRAGGVLSARALRCPAVPCALCVPPPDPRVHTPARPASPLARQLGAQASRRLEVAARLQSRERAPDPHPSAAPQPSASVPPSAEPFATEPVGLCAGGSCDREPSEPRTTGPWFQKFGLIFVEIAWFGVLQSGKRPAISTT